MELSIALHIVGIVLWLGGLMILSQFLKVFGDPVVAADGVTHHEGIRRPLESTAARIWKIFVLPGAVLVLATGVYQVLLRGIGFYMQQGWFHGKLTVLILLVVATILIGVEVQKVLAQKAISLGKVKVLHSITGFSLIAIVFLTIFGRM